MIDAELDPYADMREEVRAWLQEYRRRAGLSQRQMANRMAMSYPTIANWERGRHWPTPLHIKILNNLGRDVGMAKFPPVPPAAYKFAPTSVHKIVEEMTP